MATNFGIIYATGSKAIRRIIVPDRDTALTDGTHLAGTGETLLVAAGPANDLATCMALVQEATGQVSPYPKCVVVDKTNKVVAYAMADPALDTHPLGTLLMVSADGIAVGATFDPLIKSFTNPPTITPAGTILKDGSTVPTDIIEPGQVVLNAVISSSSV